MRKTILKEPFFVFFFIFLAVFLLTLFGCLGLLLRIENQEIENGERYYNAYVLADELRQTSDDLTKMVRLYVLTGDKKYLEQYREVISIRSGLSPLPERYNEIYWDLVLDNKVRPRPYTKPLSLKKRILEAGFTPKELALLNESETYSNELVDVEEEAIHAVQGKFKNASGSYTIEAEPNLVLARNLVSNETYMEKKAKIMEPLQSFYDMFSARYEEANSNLQKDNKRVIWISISLLVLISIGMVIFLYRALASLLKVSEANEHLLLSALPPAISEQLQQGDENSVQECEASIVFLDVKGDFSNKKEIAVLLQPLYRELDLLVERFGVERIRTLQDTYMVASGISEPKDGYAMRLADFVLAAKESIKDFGKMQGISLQIQAGMACGTVIAGVLNQKKYIYDLWGDVLKVASHLESNGIPGEIQMTKKMALEIKGSFEVEEKVGGDKIYFLRKRLLVK